MRALQARAGGGLFIAAIALWREYYSVSCASLAAPGAAALLLTVSLREQWVWRRRCLAQCQFKPETTLRRFFGSALWPTLASAALALILSFIVATELAFRPVQFMALLAVDVVIVALLMRAISWMIRSSAQGGFERLVVKSWASGLNALALLGGIVAMALYADVPRWADSNIVQMTSNAVDSVGSSCVYTNLALEIAIVKDAISWWAILVAETMFGGALEFELHLLAWAIFLISGSLSAVAFSRLIVEILDRVGLIGDDNVG